MNIISILISPENGRWVARVQAANGDTYERSAVYFSALLEDLIAEFGRLYGVTLRRAGHV